MAPPKNKAGNKKSKDSGDDAGSSKKVKESQFVNVRHILCEKFSKKEEALAAINAGGKFDDIARRFSEDKARQGGSLGWQTKAALEPDFAIKAFAVPISTVNKPVVEQARTIHGHHLIMVEGKK
ncbi:hypothetical protein PMZ80_002268 [Knufia obscura]|uniref:Peptidyl-prolyl cis-trans isomerase n=2 Tax=Knufia TaxID=430999 RepID=A0AAN8I256_9EURO|nr:hypothetical protein PMZ80_002268 [Knufia obscura]KAK5950627.1 hypothetical protein OHC33_008293 [Knufia fluminis]